jgi:hypothetical protein
VVSFKYINKFDHIIVRVQVYFSLQTAVVKFKFLVEPLVHALVLIRGVFQIICGSGYGIAGHDYVSVYSF